ncbi:MAG: hypothetical protein J6C37_04030 [Roseburia sp.]|nr:hypothetical protein [Roseburia sp.]
MEAQKFCICPVWHFLNENNIENAMQNDVAGAWEHKKAYTYYEGWYEEIDDRKKLMIGRN